MSRHLDGTGSGHPILAFLDVLEERLDDIAEAATWSLNAAETTEAITRLTTDLARVAEVEARLLLHAKSVDVHGAAGMNSLAAWLARATRMTRGQANAKVRLAGALAAHDQTRAAVAAGAVLVEQAEAITKAVDDLGGDHAALRDQAEAHLIGAADRFDAHQLTTLGQRILETIDPAHADDHEATLLADQEARARKKTTFRMRTDADGLAHGSFTIPALQAEMLKKALQGLASPKHVRAVEGAGAYHHERPTPQRLGQAFCEYIERFPTDQLPTHGGLAATIVITADAAAFTQGAPKAGRTETGQGVSPGQVLRLACEAKLLPAVLGTDGVVLDLGRGQRFHTKAQRLALIIAQQTCQHPTCDVPGSFCHVHHTRAWADGGSTDTHHAVLLCPFHHHQAHTTGATYPLRT